MYPDLAKKHGVILHPDFLRALTTLEDRAATLQLYMQRDGIHPNKDGVALIVKDIGPSALELIETTN